MTLVSIARTIREAWDELFKKEFVPEPINPLIPFVEHLETEIHNLKSEKLRLDAKCEMLQLKLEMAQAPKPVVEVTRTPRAVPKIDPFAQETSWEAIQRRQREENERLDREEAAAKG